MAKNVSLVILVLFAVLISSRVYSFKNHLESSSRASTYQSRTDALVTSSINARTLSKFSSYIESVKNINWNNTYGDNENVLAIISEHSKNSLVNDRREMSSLSSSDRKVYQNLSLEDKAVYKKLNSRDKKEFLIAMKDEANLFQKLSAEDKKVYLALDSDKKKELLEMSDEEKQYFKTLTLKEKVVYSNLSESEKEEFNSSQGVTRVAYVADFYNENVAIEKKLSEINGEITNRRDFNSIINLSSDGPPNIDLKMIYISENKPYAFIDGKLVTVNSKLPSGSVVKKVYSTGVDVLFNGEIYSISLN